LRSGGAGDDPAGCILGLRPTAEPEDTMGCILVKRFENPDVTRAFEKGRFDLVQIGGLTLGRASYAPGWKWSEHVGTATGRSSCDVEHVGIVVSGTAAVRMDDGEERVLIPGDIFEVPPGHDSWVVGEEPYVSIHFIGADRYAK
jgi:hypothetical protein